MLLLPHIFRTIATNRYGVTPVLAAMLLCCLASLLAADKVDDSGRVDDYNQWKQALGGQGATDAALVAALPGFEVELIRSAAADEGSWVSLAFDPQGRVILAREDQGLLRLTVPKRRDDQQQLEMINDSLQECRGLLFVGDALFAQANNSKGLYRLVDTNGNGQFDEVRLLREMPGGVGHGRNDLTLGPDGLIYLICGNDVQLPKGFEPGASPFRNYAVDRLLPCPWNDALFNFGVLPPAGHVVRTDTQGKRWEIFAGGFRNPFGIDFNTDGEMFTFDADMEWDAGLPWYRPCRVNHIVSGADYGWRQGIGKWPAWYPDSLPATLDIGLASPTAVKFGTHSNFPPPYRDALFILDWAYGRILAVHLTPDGTSYTATAEPFVRGRPLNVTDLEFGPDGAMYFTTGGRKTQSGLYRVRFTGAQTTADAPASAGSAAMLRQTRRKLETFHGRVDSAAVSAAWDYLDSSDRWLRHAARVAIEAQPADTWSRRALEEQRPLAGLTALMALARVAPRSWKSDILARLGHFAQLELDSEEQLLLLRAYSLAFLRLGGAAAEDAKSVVTSLERQVPSDQSAVNQLAAELLVYLADPAAPRRVLEMLRRAQSQEEKIHYLYVLSQAKTGWSSDLRRSFLLYLREADNYHGARYVPQVLGYIRADAVAKLSDAERQQFAALLMPLPAVATPAASNDENRPLVREWEMDDLVGSVAGESLGRDLENGKKMFTIAQCAACHKLGETGGLAGPDLTSVARRFGRRDLLDSVINPSKVVDDKYRSVVVVTSSGSVHTGTLLGSDAATVRLAPNPLEPQRAVHIDKTDIESQQFSLVSPMPRGTLDRLTKEEILDLLAYLESTASVSTGDRGD